MKTIPPVYHQTLEDLVGKTWEDCHKTMEHIYRKMDEDNLLVHVVLLAHGNDASRLASTEAMLYMLHDEVQQDRVQVWLSYQGDAIPAQLENYAHKGVEVIQQLQDVDDGLELPHTGKTENILRALREIHAQSSLPPEQQFVIFLDNDYLLYDAVNVHSLYIPWVMNLYNDNGVSDRNALYIKAGGMRLKFNEVLQQGDWLTSHNRPVRFGELCKESLRKVNANLKEFENIEHLIPTRDAIMSALEPSFVGQLESALNATTEQGARSSRGLSCYLHARRDVPVARYFSEFTFLLHGDQGTSLANWMNASLAPGYGLELSFLDNAMRHQRSRVINVIGLPHAHHPKNDAANFSLGIEMYEIVMDLIDQSSPFDLLPSDKSWLYYSPTKLGFKQVTLKPPEKSEFYEPLTKKAARKVGV